MKKFLVVGLIFLMGLVFLGMNGYAEESAKKNKKLRTFYPYVIYTIGDEKDDINRSYGLGLLNFSKDFQFFSETTIYYNKKDGITGLAHTFNWMPWQKHGFSKCKRYLIGLYGGLGMSMLWVDGQQKYFVAPAGIKGFYKNCYFDIKVNFFFFNETSPYITGYPSLNFGIIF